MAVIIFVIWQIFNFVFWLKTTNHLPLSKLIIIGKIHYTTNQDIYKSILMLDKLGNIITQDTNLIQQQIESLPWIKQANVRKQWPNKLKIHLTEYVPIAYWNNTCMFDINGTFFNVPVNNKHYIQFIPVFFGTENNKIDILQGYNGFNAVLLLNSEKIKNLYIKEVTMNFYYSWKIKLNNNVHLKIDQTDKIKKLKSLIEIYPIIIKHAKNKNKHIDYIDLRYDSGFAVAWKSRL